MKLKKCEICLQEVSLLYRVQYDDSRQWCFVCPSCWPSVSQNNPFYRYGGTWKARKK